MQITMGPILLLLVGLAFPLLLNGQAFSNSLFGIACALGASGWAFTLRRRVDSMPSRRRLASVVLAIALLWAVFLIVRLPGAYEFQNTFNEKMEKIRQENF